MSNKQTTAMQEMLDWLNIEADYITDDDSIEDKFARQAYRSSITKATELLTKELEIRKADAIEFAEFIVKDWYAHDDGISWYNYKNTDRDGCPTELLGSEQLYELFTQTFKQD